MNDWEELLAELERKRDFARSMGGAERLDRQRSSGKLDARQRLECLFDDGTFVEIGSLAGNLSEHTKAPAPADGLIAGFGQVEGRVVLAAAEDFTVLAGSIGDAGSAKRFRLIDLALQERAPLVFMLEGAGHRLTNEHGTPAPGDLQALAQLSGLVPTVALVMGPSAGHSALTAALSDFVVMTESSSLFTAGPPIVKGALGEVATKEQLGGADVQTRSGVAHNIAEDDRAAIAMARRYLSYFPSNAGEAPPRETAGADQRRRLDGILDLIRVDPRFPFDARVLLDMVADAGSLLEIQPNFGASLVTSLARMGGMPVAILANNPAVAAGSVDSAAAQKAAHFMEVADAFHLPVIFLTDNPGVLPGTASERAGVLRHAARMFAVQNRLRVPKLHVTLRKAFGFGSSIMAMNPFDRQTLSLAFPSVTIGAMPASSGAQAAGMDTAEQAKEVSRQSRSAWTMGHKMAYDDIIDPRELRNVLLDGLMLAQARWKGPLAPRPQGVLP
jgi:acetyl-CoA carboxylase carboxyltransferase component